MASRLRGTSGQVQYGYHVAATFAEWELSQDEGDDGAIVEVQGLVEHPVWGTYDPTEIRLSIGDKVLTYQTVEKVGDEQFRVEKRLRRVQTS